MKNLADRLTEAARGFGYDDVLLAPCISSVDPLQVDLSTSIGPVRLRRPLFAASMTGMGSLDLFLSVARAGGLAIIPQWSLSRRIALLRAVKSHPAVGEDEISDTQGRLRVAVSCSALDVGAVPELLADGADAIVLESAHAGNEVFLEAAAVLRKVVPKTVALIAGNVAAADAATRLKDAGMDAVKVGVGVGSVCTTTDVTGIGMPQVSALAEVTDSLHGSGVAVIADGGIRSGGDIVKSFAFGAAAVCVGSLFAQSLEAAGKSMVDKDGRAWRKYAANFYPSLAYKHEGKTVAGEGMEGWMPVTGSVDEIVDRLSAAVRVGMAYIGAATIAEVKTRARFIAPISSHIAEEQRRQPPISNLKPLSASDNDAHLDSAELTAIKSSGPTMVNHVPTKE
jgi:IMP dehydrogenase